MHLGPGGYVSSQSRRSTSRSKSPGASKVTCVAANDLVQRRRVKAHNPAQRAHGQSALQAPGTNGTCSPGAPNRPGGNYSTTLPEDRHRLRSVIRAGNQTR
jgi:hypothetical protein